MSLPVLVQTVQGNGGGYVNTYTKSITPTATNGLFLPIAMGAANTCTITDNNTNTWTKDKEQSLASQRLIQMWSAPNAHAGATTVTVTFGASQFADSAMFLQEFRYIATSGIADQSVAANTSSGTSYATGNTPTTTQSIELLLAAIADDSNAPAFTADANWTNLLTQAGFDSFTSCATQYRVVTDLGAYNWTLTNGSGRQTSQAIVTYKAQLLTQMLNNYQFVKGGDGLSFSERIR